MKKYKIIKEMPFGPVGEIVQSNEEGCIFIGSDCHGLVYTEEEAKILIQQGWIKEVKEEKTLLEMFDEGVDPLILKTIVMCARKRAIEIVKRVLKDQGNHSSYIEEKLTSALEKM